MKSQRHRLPEKPVNFVKIILSDDTRSIGIRIPKKFREKHGKELLESERVILKVGNGDVWQVELEEEEESRERGELWLKNGWWEFAERYGLKYGHLLMFSYEGFSIFSVIIFNPNGSEMVWGSNKDEVKNSTKGKATQSPQPTVKVKSEEETSSEEDERPQFKINDGAECSRKRQKKK